MDETYDIEEARYEIQSVRETLPQLSPGAHSDPEVVRQLVEWCDKHLAMALKYLQP